MLEKLSIIYANDFVVMDQDGGIEFQAMVKRFMNIINSNFIGMYDFKPLIDCRKPQAELTLEQVEQLFSELERQELVNTKKVAVLMNIQGATEQQKHRQVVATAGEIEIRCFDNLSEAIEWLYPEPARKAGYNNS